MLYLFSEFCRIVEWLLKSIYSRTPAISAQRWLNLSHTGQFMYSCTSSLQLFLVIISLWLPGQLCVASSAVASSFRSLAAVSPSLSQVSWSHFDVSDKYVIDAMFDFLFSFFHIISILSTQSFLEGLLKLKTIDWAKWSTRQFNATSFNIFR